MSIIADVTATFVGVFIGIWLYHEVLKERLP